MSVLSSVLCLIDSILVEVASLEMRFNGHFESGPPRPFSILCYEDCGEVNIREVWITQKRGSVEGDGSTDESRKILTDLNFWASLFAVIPKHSLQ